MSYIKWNKALTNHFFNQQNKDREVILYADKIILNEIGEKKNLGKYEDFIKCILINFDSRCDLYDEIIANPRRSGNDKIKINKELKNKIKEFPNHLSGKTGKFDLVYFNYIIFYITVFVDNTEDRSFYKNLNTIINTIIPFDNNTSPLNGLDDIFKNIEEWSIKSRNGSLGLFRARRLGGLAYLGLLKYQVVLKPNENKLLEEIIYKYYIKIDDNTLYPELANRLLPFLEPGSLRTKIIEATSNIVYAEWFLNRVKNFNHESFKNTERGKNIIVTKKGQLVFYIDANDFTLNLKSNVAFAENDNIGNYIFQPSEKDENGFYNEPILFKNTLRLSFEAITIKSNTVELNSLIINDVNFFQKTFSGGYIQTVTPTNGYDYLIAVRENQKTITKWANWITEEKNVTSFSSIEKNENLIGIFGSDYVFYIATDIKRPYFKNDSDNIIYATDFKDQTLIIKNIGGYLISNRTYIDTALPHFEIKNIEIDLNKIDVKVYRNGVKDKDIEIERVENRYYLFLNNEVYINEASLVIVKFIYDDKTETQFDFSIVPSTLVLSNENELFKLNKWGEKHKNEKAFFNGLDVHFFNKIALSTNKHKLENIKDTHSYDFNYFIYVLTSVFNYNEATTIKRKDINKAIDSSLIYLRSKGFNISEGKYSKTNLIYNLFALGYINKSKDEVEDDLFQLMPPTLIKIEKSFDSNAQVYKLVGARTKSMIQKTIDFCTENNIEIKFKTIKTFKNNTLEEILLPETIFIDLRSKVTDFIDFIKSEININIEIENQFHIGDTLISFIASIADFDSTYLKDPYNLVNQKFKPNTEEEFPYIVESETPHTSRGQLYFSKYLKTSLVTFYKDLPKGWTALFIEYKKKRPVMIMKGINGDNGFNFSPELLIPTKLRMPLVFYKAFVAFNHGIPKTTKIFIKNAPDTYKIENQSFMHFDQYFISDKKGRREDISRIMTGTNELMNNPQITFTNNKVIKKNKMSFAKCTIESDVKSIVIIKNDKEDIIAIGTNYKTLFLNSKYISDDVILKTTEVTINDILLTVVEVDTNTDKLNKTISNILDDNMTSLKILNTRKKLNIVTEIEEDIIIKELQ